MTLAQKIRFLLAADPATVGERFDRVSLADPIRARIAAAEARFARGGGCKRENAKGWVKVGTLVPIGSRPCMSNDHCHWEFR